MKRLLTFSAIALVHVLITLVAFGQSAGTPAVPPSKPGRPQPDGPTTIVTTASGSQITAHSKKGKAELVGLNKNDIVDIAVPYPAALAGHSLSVVAPDGGRVIGPSKDLVIAKDGTAQFRFKVENDPGLYHVTIYGGGSDDLALQFWVMDDDPKKNPVVINP